MTTIEILKKAKALELSSAPLTTERKNTAIIAIRTCDSNASGSRSVHAPSLPKRTYRCSEDYNRSQEKRRPKQNKVSSPETNPI